MAELVPPLTFAGGGEMGRRIRERDWSTTPLGPISGWPQSLVTTVRIMLASRYAMWMGWGPDFTFFCNDAYLPTVGVKQSWVLGSPARKVWQEIWPEIGPRAESVVNTGEATWDEGLLLFLERLGFLEETYHTFSYSPLPDDSGAIGGMLCVVTEDTERYIGERRVRTLRELAASTSPARTGIDACHLATQAMASNPHDLPFVLLYLVDSATGIVHLRSTVGIAADSPAAPLELSVQDTDHSETWPLQFDRPMGVVDLPTRFGPIHAGAWPDPVCQAVVLPLGSAGFFIAGLNTRRPLDESYRGFLHLVAGQTASAVTEARAYEEEKRRAEALAELDRAKTAFFSNVSHEFRTPLTLLLGPVEEILDLPDGGIRPSNREKLVVVHRNALRLQKLVNALLDFSRIEAGRVQARYVPTNLSVYTAELASNFRSACENVGLEYVVHCPPMDEPVYVDRDMWEKIVLNLVSNAFKFTLGGRITVSMQQEAGCAVLAVRDTGVGIPAEHVPRVFERFHRVEGSKGRSQEGTGIGLALVRELARLHGGEASAESILGEGSTFRIAIPLGVEHLPTDQVDDAPTALIAQPKSASSFVEESLRWMPAAEPEDALPIGERPRILLADDNADMRDYVRRLLTKAYHVTAVGNGLHALALARTRPFDLILSDVMMPGIDGFELLAELRSDRRFDETPIILLSARVGEEARVEGLRAGADDYLTKPFGAKELLARVASQLDLTEVRRQAAKALQAQNERLRLLSEAAAVLLVADDPDQLLSTLYDRLQPHLHLSGYFNYIADDATETLHLTSAAGLSAEDTERFRRLPYGVGLCGVIARTHEPLVVDDIQTSNDPRAAWPKSHGLRAYAGMPLLAGGKLLGTLAFVTRERDTFDVEDLDFLETIAHYVTAAYERLQYIEQLRDADRRKDEFLATLAHELRNPLAPIRNALQIIKLTAGSESLHQARAMMERQLTQLVRLVDDLLEVSRISRGKVVLRMEPIDLITVVRMAAEAARPLLDRASVTLELDLPEQPLTLEGDSTRLAQVFTNLLNNAAKFTDPGGQVTVSVSRENGQLITRVRDTGIGIPPEHLPRLFELFSQVDRSLERTQGGLGIGLALVRGLVQLHGGIVGARSEGIGKGSEFTVILPAIVQKAPAPAPMRVEDSVGGVVRKRILVVDDNRDAAESMGDLLELIGHDVRKAFDGEEALTIAEGYRPEIVLLDIGLPKLNGYDTCRQLRQQPTGKEMLIVALTGWGQEEDRRRSREAGFDLHFTKPVDPDQLMRLVNESGMRLPEPHG